MFPVRLSMNKQSKLKFTLGNIGMKAGMGRGFATLLSIFSLVQATAQLPCDGRL